MTLVNNKLKETNTYKFTNDCSEEISPAMQMRGQVVFSFELAVSEIGIFLLTQELVAFTHDLTVFGEG